MADLPLLCMTRVAANSQLRAIGIVDTEIRFDSLEDKAYSTADGSIRYASPQFERRTGLACKTFTLELSLGDTAATKGGNFSLEVKDTADDRYVLVSNPVSDDAGLIALLLRRIANQQGKAGWKFEANFYASKNAGIITG